MMVRLNFSCGKFDCRNERAQNTFVDVNFVAIHQQAEILDQLQDSRISSMSLEHSCHSDEATFPNKIAFRISIGTVFALEWKLSRKQTKIHLTRRNDEDSLGPLLR